MKVFISWSGTTSRSVAEALAQWLPKVIQGVDPFVSAKDIDKGSNWTVELSRQLEDAEFGIICLAPDNLLSPWLNYEAGAITKSVNSRVCPILFGVEKSDVKPPLSQLQLTSVDIQEFELLVGSINKAAGAPISIEAVREAVDVWWPRLKAELDAIPIPETSAELEPAEPAKPPIDIAEMIEEVLQRIRAVDQRVRRIERPSLTRLERSAELAADRLSPSIRTLMTAALHAGLEPTTATNSQQNIEIVVGEELPQPLPYQLFEVASDISRAERVDISILGPNREALFRRNGETSETPF